MKQKSIIVTSFLFSFFLLTSCGDGSPSACDCAEYIKAKGEEAREWNEANGVPDAVDDFDAYLDATTTPEAMEHTRQIIEKWEPKTKPCEEKKKANPSFEDEITECLRGMY